MNDSSGSKIGDSRCNTNRKMVRSVLKRICYDVYTNSCSADIKQRRDTDCEAYHMVNRSVSAPFNLPYVHLKSCAPGTLFNTSHPSELGQVCRILYIPSNVATNSCHSFRLPFLSKAVPISLDLARMKFIAIGLCVSLATAFPQGKPLGATMAQTIAGLKGKDGLLDGGYEPKIRNEVIESAPCGKVVFIFARASQEPTNMVLWPTE